MKRLHKRYLAVFSAAILCLLLSIYFDLVLHGWQSGPIVVSDMVLESSEGFFRELGFAFIIAWMISVGIEEHARSEDGRRADDLRRIIAEDVFKGVFSRQLPRKYIDRVAEVHLYAPVIRDNMRMHMVLIPLDEDQEDEWHLPKTRFSILRNTYEYELVNASAGPIRYPLNIMFPIRRERAEAASRLIEIAINGTLLTDEEREAALKISEGNEGRQYLFNIDMASGQRVAIRSVTQLLKEIGDGEVWISLIPTLSLELKFENRIPRSISGMRYSGGPIQPEDEYLDGRVKEYSIRSAILKGESLQVWWRKLPANKHPRAGTRRNKTS